MSGAAASVRTVTDGQGFAHPHVVTFWGFFRRLNKEEYDAYVHECGLEVKTLHALVWKEALDILHLQQRILSDVGLPHMTITTDSAAVAKQREIVQALQLAHVRVPRELAHPAGVRHGNELCVVLMWCFAG